MTPADLSAYVAALLRLTSDRLNLTPKEEAALFHAWTQVPPPAP